ncbi:MAG: peptidoglycan DD-metalloendopeptidase family protein, partial [Anaerolineae bacterium]|nr:peptidoglycan DD-metalloendopeptidase family protein [Anaerolineae bacterium]
VVVSAGALLRAPAQGAAVAALAMSVVAQDAPCGVVDALDYPLDISETLANRYDDFGLFRARFGGRHTGLDVAFNRLGEPVYAAARGLVTYADPEGWDTEKGVVIIRHTFPDGIYYTLYGHMEQSDEIQFPRVGTCVERGDPVGVVGWPSRGLPHLHYEIRNFLPDDGGPGYVTDNPVLSGWFDPLDFTEMWRMRLAPGYVGSVSFAEVPTLPPVILDDGTSVIAQGDDVIAYTAQGRQSWRVTADGVVTGLVGLPDNRVVAHTRSGQAFTVSGGRYAALWTMPGPDAPVILLGSETLVFVGEGGTLAAYTPQGEALWSLPGVGAVVGVIDFQSSGDQVALAVRRVGGVHWRVVAADGRIAYETTFASSPQIAPVRGGGWFALAGDTLYHVASRPRAVTSIDAAPGRTARMTADLLGNVYIFVGDRDNTLLSLSPGGQVRWRRTYPAPLAAVAPLLRTDNGCLLYTLDVDGALHIFNARTGERVNEKQIYAGGIQNGSPPARILQALPDGRVLVGGGFLSAVVLDGAAISNGAMQNCVLG